MARETIYYYFPLFQQLPSNIQKQFQLLKIFSVFLTTLVACFYQRATKRGFTLIISMNSYIISILSSLLCCSQSRLFHFFISSGKHRKHLAICREVPQETGLVHITAFLRFLTYVSCFILGAWMIYLHG